MRVSQSKAQQIFIGQQAIIDTRRDIIMGSVSRIDPVVVENTVEVEIALPSKLPKIARPQLTVDATIITDTLTDVTYMERPVNAKENSQMSLYKLDESTGYAVKVDIKFGREAGRYIEVIEGGKVNDIFIVSDLSHLKNLKLEIESF